MFLKYNLITFLWAIFLLLITLTPGKAMPATGHWDLPHADKVVHFVGFGVLAFLMMRGFNKQNKYNWLRKESILSSLLLTISFGIIIEILQIFVPERSFDLLDIVANTTGALTGLGFYLFSIK
jgi:VanZ family protein